MGILQQASGTFNGASFTATLPAASSASNTVVVIIGADTTVTTPASWALRTSQVNEMAHYLYDRAGVSLTSVSFTTATGPGTWWIFEVNGAHVSSSSANNVNQASSYNTPNLTPTAGTRTLVASIGSLHNAATRTVSGWTSSFVEQVDVCATVTAFPQAGGAALVDQTVNGSTAYSTTATYSLPSTSKSAIIAAYASSAGGGTVDKTGADTASVTDTGAEFTANLAPVDSATVADAAAEASTAGGVDAAAVADASAVLQIRPGVVDAATVTDAGAGTATLAGADTGTVADAGVLVASPVVVGAATVTEVLALSAARSLTDAGTLTDTAGVVVGGLTLTGADTGTVADTAGLTAVAAAVDAGAVADASSSTATDAATDATTLTDTAVVTVNGVTVAGSDAGTLSEARVLASTLGVQDGTTVAELLALSVTAAARSDLWALTDGSAVTMSAQPTVADTWLLTESRALTAAVAVVEQLAGTELLSLVATLAGADQATLTDLALVALPAADVPPALLHAGGRDRWRAVGRVLAYAARGRAGRYVAHGKQ